MSVAEEFAHLRHAPEGTVAARFGHRDVERTAVERTADADLFSYLRVLLNVSKGFPMVRHFDKSTSSWELRCELPADVSITRIHRDLTTRYPGADVNLSNHPARMQAKTFVFRVPAFFSRRRLWTWSAKLCLAMACFVGAGAIGVFYWRVGHLDNAGESIFGDVRRALFGSGAS
jgi:hypothetical protein